MPANAPYSHKYVAALTEVLLIEGGYSNDQDDPGGETMYGIARAYWPQYWKDGRPTRETAARFYLKEFWTPLKCEQIRDGAVAYELFESSINLGMSTGVLIAQNACIVLGEDVLDDGAMGRETLGALNRLIDAPDGREDLVIAVNGLQLGYYIARSRQSPKAKKYLKGWRKRCMSRVTLAKFR